MEIFIDGFGAYNTRTRTTTGVYISFANIRSKYKYTREYIYTYMVIPPGVELKEALAPLVADLKELEEHGMEVAMFPDGKMIRLFGAPAYILSDHVQACQTIGHCGNNSLKNCRCCMVDKKDRCVFDKSIIEHDHTRNTAVSRAQRAQMRIRMGANPSAFAKSCIQRLYGLYVDPSVFDTVLDVHQMTMPCVGHALDIGICKRLVIALLDAVRECDYHIFRARLEGIEWPRGWSKVTLGMITKTGRLAQPMSSYRKIAMMATQLFNGLVPQELLDLTMGMVKLRGMIMQEGHSLQSVAETQAYGKSWIEKAMALHRSGRYPNLKLDVPNMHLVIEILVRFLPLTMDMRCTGTNRFEGHHKKVKFLCSKIKQVVGGAPELYALRQEGVDVAVRNLFEGARYGPGLRQRIGSGFLQLYANRQTPTWALFNGLDLSDKELSLIGDRVNVGDGGRGRVAIRVHEEKELQAIVDVYEAAANDDPAGSDNESEVHFEVKEGEEVVIQENWNALWNIRVPARGKDYKIPDAHEPTLRELFLLQKSIDEYYAEDHVVLRDIDPCTIQYRWKHGFEDSSKTRFMNGDFVAINERKERQYAQMMSSLEMTVRGKIYFFIFLRWFKRIRGSTLLPDRVLPPVVEEFKLNPRSFPITPRHLLHEVYIVHNCVRYCNREIPCADPLRCRCNKKCKHYQWCLVHKKYTCPESCKPHFQTIDKHHKDLHEYMVFDHEWNFQSIL